MLGVWFLLLDLWKKDLFVAARCFVDVIVGLDLLTLELVNVQSKSYPKMEAGNFT